MERRDEWAVRRAYGGMGRLVCKPVANGLKTVSDDAFQKTNDQINAIHDALWRFENRRRLHRRTTWGEAFSAAVKIGAV